MLAHIAFATVIVATDEDSGAIPRNVWVGVGVGVGVSTACGSAG
jgi:hypothetical protein